MNPEAGAPAGLVGDDAAVRIGTGNGPGVVVFPRFTATSIGNASVDCRFADVRDSQDNSTQPPCSSTSIHEVGPVPTQATRWSTLKSLQR